MVSAAADNKQTMALGADDLPEYGPKMAALANDKRRAFVLALFRAPRGKGQVLWAARMAGYGTPTSSEKCLGAIGSRLKADETVQDAIDEVCRNEIRALGPDAIMGVRELIKDKSHRDHGRALGMIIDRIAPVTTNHNVNLRDDRIKPEKVTEQVLARIEEIAARYNLDSPRPVIEGDFSVVETQEATQ
jgi:hypothetical protein